MRAIAKSIKDYTIYSYVAYQLNFVPKSVGSKVLTTLLSFEGLKYIKEIRKMHTVLLTDTSISFQLPRGPARIISY